MQKIEPISRYYLGKDGKLHPKSRLLEGIRYGLVVSLSVFSLLYPDNVYTEGLNFTSVQVKNYHEDYVLSHNPKVDAREIVSSVNKWGKELSVDPKLLLAVAKVESTFDPHAISKSGAYGLMQVIPVWHKEKILQARRELGNPEIFNISTNIYLGAKVLKECLEKTGGVTKALQCYSGQTPGYDAKVLAEYRRLQKI